MGVVSVRLDDHDEAFLRKQKMNISELAREAVHREVRRLEVEQQMKRLEGHRYKPDEPAAATIRRLRDSRHA